MKRKNKNKNFTVILDENVPDSKGIETNHITLLGHGTSSKQWKEVKVGNVNTISEVHGQVK